MPFCWRKSAYDYFMTLAAGGPLVVVNFIHMNLLRAEGMSKESMIGSVSGLVVNIILDPIFISVLGWGAFGAAFASVIGYACSDYTESQNCYVDHFLISPFTFIICLFSSQYPAFTDSRDPLDVCYDILYGTEHIECLHGD